MNRVPPENLSRLASHMAIMPDSVSGLMQTPVVSGAGRPCSTAFGPFAGNAFAARTALPGPVTGPYRAIFASIAKRNARRQRKTVSAARRKVREAANLPDILEFYHAGIWPTRKTTTEMESRFGSCTRFHYQRVIESAKKAALRTARFAGMRSSLLHGELCANRVR